MIVENIANQFMMGTLVFSFLIFLSLLVLGWIIGTKPKMFMTFIEKYPQIAFLLLVVYIGAIVSALFMLFSGGI